MKNIKNNKGFTLAELLIVIAIIAALVAIMIPTFRGQVQKAEQAADVANLRAAYADATAKYLTGEDKTPVITISKTKSSSLPADTNLPFDVTMAKDMTKATFTFEDADGKALDRPTCALGN